MSVKHHTLNTPHPSLLQRCLRAYVLLSHHSLLSSLHMCDHVTGLTAIKHKQEGKCKLVNFTCLHWLHINDQWNWLTPDNHNPPVEPTYEAWPDVFLCHVDERTLGLLRPFVELFSLDYLLHSWEVLITPSCCCSMFLRGKTTPIWISSASCPVTLQPGGDDSSEGHEPDTTALQL